MQNEHPLLEISHLSREFSVGKNKLAAVTDVNLCLNRGECLGIVGESGCGKSTLARMVIGALRPSSGKILLDQVDYWNLKKREQSKFRRRIQMVFQEPVSSFSPRMKIGTYLMEPRRNYDHISKAQAEEEARKLLVSMGLPENFISRYPHELSGGQLQRVAIARAIAVGPDLLVCDEATGALDVSVQSQIVQLLAKLQAENGIACLFIGHDLALVRSVSHRIAVMYLGRVVEILDSEDLVQQARHPYTLALLGAVLDVYCDPQKEIPLLSGDPPSPLDLPAGCAFASRCSRAGEQCKTRQPELCSLGGAHWAACHYLNVD